MKALDRKDIWRTAPWLKPGKSPSEVIAGDDLDALLSLAIYLKVHPKARFAGMYTGFRHLMVAEGAMKSRVPLVWIDLDIAVKGARSLGHHVLRPRTADPSPIQSPGLNLNDLRAITMARYREKYPLGTAHFLIWLYELPVPRGSLFESLVWLCDSAFINGQSHRYRENVGGWLAAMPHPDLARAFDELDHPAFEDRMALAIEALQNLGLRGGRVQTRSAHRALSSHPIHLSPWDIETFNRFCRWLGDQTGLPDPLSRKIDGDVLTWRGVRNREAVGSLLNGRSLRKFLDEEKVFSYALPGMGEMNHTLGIAGKGLHTRIRTPK